MVILLIFNQLVLNLHSLNLNQILLAINHLIEATQITNQLLKLLACI